MLLGHPPDARAEAVVPDELGELDPRLDLLRSSGRRAAPGAAERIRASKPGSMSRPVERLVEELGDDPPALLAGQAGELVHGLHLLWVAGSSGDRPQHRALDAQHPDLGVDRRRVGGGDVGDRELPLEHAPDGREIDPELAQRPHQAEPRERVGPYSR